MVPVIHRFRSEFRSGLEERPGDDQASQDDEPAIGHRILRGTLPTSDRPTAMMRGCRARRKSTTAASVPIWVIAVNRAPGRPRAMNSPTMRM
jgi:hypothetical protein